MELFHVDVLLYAVYLFLVAPKNLKRNSEILEIEGLILSSVFMFFVFVMVLFLCKQFPLIMFFYLSFNLYQSKD